MIEDYDGGSASTEEPRARHAKIPQTAVTPPQTTPIQHDPPLALPEKIRIHHRVKLWFLDLNRTQQVILLVATALLLIVAVVGALGGFGNHGKLTVLSSHSGVSGGGATKPTTVASTLSGLQVEAAVNQRQVTGAMIENSTDARPQSGLDQAGIVFEAEAEGGVTRFMALFQDTQPSYIGPVRSARPYYLQWCQAFDCALAHVGGSPDALQDIKDWNIKDLNQFAGGSYFQRTGRPAPHNVYTSISQLNAFETKKGYNSSTYTGFSHLAKEPKVKPAAITARVIAFNYQGSAYDVHYEYDQPSNTYKRSEGGAVHNVADASGAVTQISPKVVIAMAVPRSQGALDASNAYYSVYQNIGSGPVQIFQNGTEITGTWTKSAAASQIVFTDASGKPIKLDPGQAWITVLDTITDASYY